MKLCAEISCAYSSEKIASAVAGALRPDNLKLPEGLRVSTKVYRRNVVSVVELDGRMETLLATIDDLLACAQTAESMLR